MEVSIIVGISILAYIVIVIPILLKKQKLRFEKILNDIHNNQNKDNLESVKPKEKVIDYRQCPYCQSTDTLQPQPRLLFRYWYCNSCGNGFESR